MELIDDIDINSSMDILLNDQQLPQLPFNAELEKNLKIEADDFLNSIFNDCSKLENINTEDNNNKIETTTITTTTVNNTTSTQQQQQQNNLNSNLKKKIKKLKREIKLKQKQLNKTVKKRELSISGGIVQNKASPDKSKLSNSAPVFFKSESTSLLSPISIGSSSGELKSNLSSSNSSPSIQVTPMSITPNNISSPSTPTLMKSQSFHGIPNYCNKKVNYSLSSSPSISSPSLCNSPLNTNKKYGHGLIQLPLKVVKKLPYAHTTPIHNHQNHLNSYSPNFHSPRTTIMNQQQQHYQYQQHQHQQNYYNYYNQYYEQQLKQQQYYNNYYNQYYNQQQVPTSTNTTTITNN